MKYRKLLPTVLDAFKNIVDSLPNDVYKTELGERLELLYNQLKGYPLNLELPDEDLVGMYHMRFNSISKATVLSAYSEAVKNILFYSNDLLNYLDNTIISTGKPHIVLATGNKGKLKDFTDFLKNDGFVVFCVKDLLVNVPDTVEDQNTFQGNAMKKATELANYLPKSMYSLADDSGICVRALGGRPGVFSHRYASEDPTEEENNNLLLKEVGDAKDRYAYYLTILSLKRGQLHSNDFTINTNPLFTEDKIACFEGLTEGSIGYVSRGINGFAYDKIFIPEYHKGNTLTMSELPDKVRISLLARNRALAKLVDETHLWFPKTR